MYSRHSGSDSKHSPTAYAIGLGTCWVGEFREEEVKKAIGLPNGVGPFAIISIGHAAANSSKKRPRRLLKEITHDEEF